MYNFNVYTRILQFGYKFFPSLLRHRIASFQCITNTDVNIAYFATMTSRTRHVTRYFWSKRTLAVELRCETADARANGVKHAKYN